MTFQHDMHLPNSTRGTDAFSGPSARAVPEEPIPVRSLELSTPVPLFPTGWTTALRRATPRIKSRGTALEVAKPRVMFIGIGRTRVPIHSYVFPPVDESSAPTVGSAPSPRPAGKHARHKASSVTRIRPPRDIIKLYDRLFYVLQPPLETLVGSAQLLFPFAPFAYQYEGIAFLYSRYAAVLADEMGLGKTMQAITTIRLLMRGGEVRSVLLVCPKPLVTNWQREFALWAPEVPVMVVEGAQTRRHWQWRQPNAPVQIANYELLLRDADLLRDRNPPFDLVVLDEAQRIKNRSSSTSQVARSIPRRRSWALTGTPIENSPEDLVAIFDFLLPGYLRRGMEPRRIGRATSDYVLRRTKRRVLSELPPILYRDAELELAASQYETYHLAEEQGVVQLEGLGARLTIQHVFELILRLKQVCNFDPATGASSKLERLEADLEEVASSGQKAIVFSQWVRTLETLRDRLARFGPLEYHGKIPARRRDAVVQQFRQDPSRHVLLMSYGAGSVGLNLQFCGYVFLFDRWWNPAVEDQAINRAHRIGAQGPVTVTRMMTLGTIEQRIHEVLEQKRELFNLVFSETAVPSNLGLNQEEIFGLFELKVRPAAQRHAA